MLSSLLCAQATASTDDASGERLNSSKQPRPNIVLVMADDQGWGQTGYNGHPLLKTPNLDAMAAAGLRLDRFYAAAPVCSPTRASVLTGRTNMRTGVETHGYALRRQERTLAQALRDSGYATAHFGKWHLNGIRGPGVPLLASDPYHPGHFGFQHWLSTSNYFDRDPLLSHRGNFEDFRGDSSEIIVRQALQFITHQAMAGQPSFSVIWFGSPHSPFTATAEDTGEFQYLDARSRQHYGELVAMDRSIGALREGLRRLEIQQNTLVWYCSDNGGLSGIRPKTVGNLRGNKGNLYEGGIRVPGIVEWPETITPGRSSHPACTSDIFPTLAELLQLPPGTQLAPSDGISLAPLMVGAATGAARKQPRPRPLGFMYRDNTAWIDNRYKLLELKTPKKNASKPRKRQATNESPSRQHELYDLQADPTESQNLFAERPQLAQRMLDQLRTWQESVRASITGADYPTSDAEAVPYPAPRHWTKAPEYQPYLDVWSHRPEYGNWIKRNR